VLEQLPAGQASERYLQAPDFAVLRQHEISLQRRRRWCISTDPAFA
jgi:hypothetical protein